jgi:hypothetical protein
VRNPRAAHRSNTGTGVNISSSGGGLWPNVMKDGVPDDAVPVIAGFGRRNLMINMPASMASPFADPNGRAMKTLESAGDHDRKAGLNARRLGGHCDFGDGISARFGDRLPGDRPARDGQPRDLLEVAPSPDPAAG